MIFDDGLYYQLGCILLLVIALLPIARGLLGPMAKVPGPWYNRVTSWVTAYHDLTGNGPVWIRALHDKYGTIVCVGPSTVDLSSAEDAAQVHSFKRTFPKTEWYSNLVPDSDTVFSTRNVETHRRDRKLLSGPLSETGLRAFTPQVQAKVSLAVRRMREEAAARGAADVLHWWLSMATDVIGELSFGESFRTLETGEKSAYIRNLERASEMGGLLVTFPALRRIPTWLNPVPRLRGARSMIADLHGYAAVSVQRHRDMLDAAAGAAAPAKVAARPTLFTKVMQAAAHDSEHMPLKEVQDQAQGYIVAGSDTTSTALTYLVWTLCRPKHASIRSRVLAELATIPADAKKTDINAYHEHLRKLPYLDQVISETLRCYSSVPASLPRHVPEGGAVFGRGGGGRPKGMNDGNDDDRDGIFLPAGTTVQIGAYSMHRDPILFPDPEKFDPDRWAAAAAAAAAGGDDDDDDDDGSSARTRIKAMRNAWIPFGGGSRVCIGLHLALMEIRLGVAAFLAEFPDAKVSGREGFREEVDMRQESFILMAPRGHRCLIDVE